MNGPVPPSYPPSLQVALLSTLLALAGSALGRVSTPRCLRKAFPLPHLNYPRYRHGTMRVLTPAPVHPGTGLPASCVPPSHRSVPNHVMRSTIAFAATLAWSMSSRLHLLLAGSPLTSRRIGFVVLRTDSSPPVAPHPASRRRSYLRLQSLWHTPTRTYTVLMKRPYGRTRSGLGRDFRCWNGRAIAAKAAPTQKPTAVGTRGLNGYGGITPSVQGLTGFGLPSTRDRVSP